MERGEGRRELVYARREDERRWRNERRNSDNLRSFLTFFNLSRVFEISKR